MKPVRLSDIALAIGADTGEGIWFLDTESGTTELVTENVLDAALRKVELPLEDIPADIKLMYNLAVEILHDDGERFIKLPGQLDILEWDMMRRFAAQQADQKIRADLVEAVQGATAFQAFQWRVRKYRLSNQWDQFRERALEAVAIEWCQEHGIAFD